uniref:DNA-directed RNA polymerase n=1 Tax=viral metagenome TaxID=1070528 RepID=A0A6C0ARC9_9ZZZZ
MSDNSDYDSDRDSDNDSVSIEDTVQNKKLLFKPSINIKPYEAIGLDDEDELDDAEEDDAEEDDIEEDDVEEEDDENQVILGDGGPKDHSDNEDDNNISDEEDVSDDEDEEGIKYNEDGNLIQKASVKSSAKPKKTQLIIENDDDEDNDYDDNYLQKFDNDISKNYIEEFHPECLSHNYDEVAKLSIVIKNSNGIIIDPLHRTIPYLTKYEKARILGQRAKQIETGSRPYVKVPENIVDGYIIAELELKEKKIPFIIRRPIPGGAFEYWNLKDLEFIHF